MKTSLLKDYIRDWEQHIIYWESIAEVEVQVGIQEDIPKWWRIIGSQAPTPFTPLLHVPVDSLSQ